MRQDGNNTEIVVQQDGGIVQVTLNRPDVLNVLSLEMIRVLAAGLERWEADADVRAVFLDGAGDRAFCAGGDVKSAYRTGMSYRMGEADEHVLSLFFAEEYRLNRQLYRFRKPVFVFMEGIVMGGGFGIAAPCRYRIACENTQFAMPEVGIGFFPDVGSMYYLSRAPGEAGTFLALSGESVGADDMIHCGFASHYVPLGKIESCREGLRQAIQTGGDVEAVLSSFHAPPSGHGEIARNAALIDRCFAGDSVVQILERLQECGDVWGQEKGAVVARRSPVSLAVSLAHLRRARGEAFDEVIARDFTLAQHFLKGHDFYEGVRAAIVDKDRKPSWVPDRIGDVSAEAVMDYFRPQPIGLDGIAVRYANNA